MRVVRSGAAFHPSRDAAPACFGGLALDARFGCLYDAITMEDDPLKILGQRIRELRVRQGLSQDKLALMIGSSSKGGAYISRMELGKCNPSIKVLSRIAKALDVKVRDLIDF